MQRDRVDGLALENGDLALSAYTPTYEGHTLAACAHKIGYRKEGLAWGFETLAYGDHTLAAGLDKLGYKRDSLACRFNKLV